jgi:hypothetical protein
MWATNCLTKKKSRVHLPFNTSITCKLLLFLERCDRNNILNKLLMITGIVSNTSTTDRYSQQTVSNHCAHVYESIIHARPAAALTDGRRHPDSSGRRASLTSHTAMRNRSLTGLDGWHGNPAIGVFWRRRESTGSTNPTRLLHQIRQGEIQLV